MAEVPHNYPWYFEELFEKLNDLFPTLSRKDKLKKWEGMEEDYEWSFQNLNYDLENGHLKLTPPQARLVKDVNTLYKKYQKELFPTGGRMKGGKVEDNHLTPFSYLDKSHTQIQNLQQLNNLISSIEGFQNQWKTYKRDCENEKQTGVDVKDNKKGIAKAKLEIERYEKYLTYLRERAVISHYSGTGFSLERETNNGNLRMVGGDKPPPNDDDKLKKIPEEQERRERAIIAHLAALDRERLRLEREREQEERQQMFNEDKRKQELLRRERMVILTHEIDYLYNTFNSFQGTNRPSRDLLNYLINFYNDLFNHYPEIVDVSYQRENGIENALQEISDFIDFWNDQRLEGDRELPRQ
jgi:hypothetical protein